MKLVSVVRVSALITMVLLAAACTHSTIPSPEAERTAVRGGVSVATDPSSNRQLEVVAPERSPPALDGAARTKAMPSIHRGLLLREILSILS